MLTSGQEAAATRRMTLRDAALAAWTILFALLIPPPGWAADGILGIPSHLPPPLPGVNLFVSPERQSVFCPPSSVRFPFSNFAAPVNPSPTVGDTITLTAQPSSDPQLSYQFSAVLLPSGQTFGAQAFNVQGNVATFRPSKGGDYTFKVVVRKGALAGSAHISDYHVTRYVVPLDSNANKSDPILRVTLSANPAIKALPGDYKFKAVVSGQSQAQPLKGPVKNKFWFRYAQHFQGYPVTCEGPVVPPGSTLEWQPHPPSEWQGQLNPDTALLPGVFAVEVYVQSFRKNELVAEGLFVSLNAPPESFYRGYYVVLLPSQPCPPFTPTTDAANFGWSRPITSQNVLFDGSVLIPQVPEACPIAGFVAGVEAGYSISDITNKPDVRVRKVNVSCANCHGVLPNSPADKNWFCGAIPTLFPHLRAPGDGPDTQNESHELTLYTFFAAWKSQGCLD